MNFIRFICKTNQYTHTAERIKAFCAEHDTVICSEDAKPYWKYDDCVEADVTFDNRTDNVLLERLFTGVFGSIDDTDEDLSQYNAYHYSQGNPDEPFAQLHIDC